MSKKKKRRSYNRPYFLPLLLIGAGTIAYLYLLLRYGHGMTRLLLLSVAIGVLLSALFFFAQFTLPVHGWKERWEVFVRLLYYMVGGHGPALFIQDGHVIENKVERFRKGPGVIVLDTASAAVLKNAANFTRAVGPGVVFTKRGETIPQGAALDLRKRSASMGPNPGEDPFAPQGADEKPEAYRKRQGRRWETSAKTQDGTEVVARLVVVFSLDPHPDGLSEETYQQYKFRTAFKGHGVSAWRAIVHRPINTEKHDGALSERLLPWDWLPSHLAADLWREYLQLFKLSELFQDVQNGQSALDLINAAIKERLTSPFYHVIGQSGQSTGHQLPSKEYALLQNRGIRVITFLVTEVFLPPEVEQGLIGRWAANWKARAEKERQVVEQKRLAAQKRGEEAANLIWEQLVARACQQAAIEETTPAQCLERLLSSLIQNIQDDPALYQTQRTEIHNLQMLWAWVYDTSMSDQETSKESDR